MKILLVVDSKFLRLATERAMVRTGYEVTSAADGERGLRLGPRKAAGSDSIGHAAAETKRTRCATGAEA